MLIAGVFALCYLGMALGRLPGLRLDRSGIALAAAGLLLVSGAAPLREAVTWIHTDTLLLLLGLMILSAQFQFAGVYDALGGRLAALAARPRLLLAVVIGVAGSLSAVLVNDIVALALAPLLIQRLAQQGRPLMPYLIALACACNAGSAASLVGNPQNILIGQVGGLDFWTYAAVAVVPTALALVTVFVVIAAGWHERWGTSAPGPAVIAHREQPRVPSGHAWLALGTLLLLFSSALPRELSALAVALLVMLSRPTLARRYLQAVDWRLLLLFCGLFVVTGAFTQLPWVADTAARLAAEGGLPDTVLRLGSASLIGSNLVGNVPFVMLLLQAWPTAPPDTLMGLALLSTFAGNFLLVGSVVNLIVAESARRLGQPLGFWAFARVGMPVSLLSMSLAGGWLALTDRLPLS